MRQQLQRGHNRQSNYKSHLAKCTYYKAAQIPAASPTTPIQPVFATAAIDTSPVHYTETALLTSQRPVKTAAQLPIGDTASSSKSRTRWFLVLEMKRSPRKNPPVMKKAKHEKRKFSRSEYKQIERSLIKLHADNHLADRFIEQDSTQRFMELVCPGLTDILPSHRALGTRVLKEHAARCKSVNADALRLMKESTKGWVNLLSDSIADDLLPAGPHHGIAIAKQLEEVSERALGEKWRVGACVTDDAGQFGRARRILALRRPQVVFLHCFAHAVNNLVKTVLKSSFRDVATKAANAVNAINASSSKWLPRVHKMMNRFYGRSLGLQTLCETRWNIMQGCFASLLRVQTALEMFFRKFENDI
ncbi:hypothetical protein DVH05_004871 [Phytophthora capsici]|nr:hypothetical protein DVH05_006645 [Phytophthora capsici]KAG1704842.1 hypothetical protein DVH05_004871 [Phytophthora capsici]